MSRALEGSGSQCLRSHIGAEDGGETPGTGLSERDHKAKDLLDLVGSVLRTDCPTKLGLPSPEPARAPRTAEEQMILDQKPLEPRGNHYGFLHVAMKTDLELSGNTPAERAAIIAKVSSIRTRGEAKAYMRSVVARVRAVQAAMRQG